MKIFVKIKPNSKKKSFEKIEPLQTQCYEQCFLAAVKEPPVENKANAAVIKLIAKYFNLSPLKVKIVAGHKSKQKFIEIY